LGVLGSSQKPVVMRRYPHMLFEDVEVWTRFLQIEHPVIHEVWYDVHVGEPMGVPPGSGPAIAAVAAGVSRKRIDAICRVNGGHWIVEVKPFGNMVALGQALGYWSLVMKEFVLDGRVWPVVVCDKVDPDIKDAFSSLGVLVFETGYTWQPV